MFHTAQSLITHTIEEHSVVRWACTFCSNMIDRSPSSNQSQHFDVLESWKAHVLTNHAEQIRSLDLDVVAAESQQSTIPCQSCPLCPNLPPIDSTNTTRIPDHILYHLRKFSLESLPKRFQKKSIDDFVILEDMGQGAFAQVNLCKHKVTGQKSVIKFVTKRRILVDLWARDRRGTLPLEIHVLDYLNHLSVKSKYIVEMSDFFEDDINWYIEMVPHGLPGMDLFDYIELKESMDEDECRSIFVQAAKAVHFLHTQAKVVHRNIKDENFILDGEGNLQLIDFGSAAYIKSGPFDVFTGTIGMSLQLFFHLKSSLIYTSLGVSHSYNNYSIYALSPPCH